MRQPKLLQIETLGKIFTAGFTKNKTSYKAIQQRLLTRIDADILENNFDSLSSEELIEIFNSLKDATYGYETLKRVIKKELLLRIDKDTIPKELRLQLILDIA